MFSLHCRTICNGTNVAMFRAAHPGKKMKKMLCWNRNRSVVNVGGRGGNAGVQQSRVALNQSQTPKVCDSGKLVNRYFSIYPQGGK